jgi:5S rRNA maturation endonuclease (ribonuclease M5)
MQLTAPLTIFISSRSKFHRVVFLFAITLYALGIPFSRFMMSMGGAILVINWFIEGNIEQKVKKVFQSKIILSCLIIYFIHLLWLISSENILYGLEDLWIKIPLFFIPIIFYTSESLSHKEYQNILILYVLGVFISSFSGFITYLFGNFADKREMALFISYLRFEINICFVCFVCLYLFFKAEIPNIQKIIIVAALCWFLFFLLYSGSITAIVLFFIVGTIIIIKTAIRNQNKFFRYFIPSLFAIGMLCTSVVIYHSIKQYFNADFSIETAAKYTPDGNLYFHNPQKAYIENGSYIFIYISDVELEKAWNKRSNINFNDSDKNGFSIRTTLIRYLNSKGLYKDRLGVEALSEKDICNIEQGIANVFYTHKLHIVSRIYSVLWEINDYYYSNSVIGYSIPQRIELWKYSIQTIKKYPILGVGTGDVKDVFAQELELGSSPLAETNMRSHNQYFTFAIAFGTVGLLLILFSIFYPVFVLKKFKNPLFLVFFCIIIFSMITEDTLEPQDGVTFFAFFYSFFLFLFPKEN